MLSRRSTRPAFVWYAFVGSEQGDGAQRTAYPQPKVRAVAYDHQMDDKYLVAIIAAMSAIVGGLITSVLGPVIKHHLDQSVEGKARKRSLVQTWRNIIIDVHREADGDMDVGPLLQKHTDYLSLEPHLSAQARQAVHADNLVLVVGQVFAEPLAIITREIGHIEGVWGLRK